MRIRFVAPLLAVSTLAVATTGRADPTPQEAILAQTLFDDAREKMAAGNYAEACPKFAESYRLDPGGGTLLNLGMCHEGEGKFATAYAELSDALSQAIRDKRAEREKTAREHLANVTAHLSKLRIHVVAGAPPGLQVKVDGVLLAPAAWDVAVPMDAGPHVVAVSAPGRQASETTVLVASDGSTKDFEVGALAAGPEGSGEPPPASDQPQSPTPSAKSGSPLRIVGFAALGVGGATAITGGIFGILAATTWSKVHTACPSNVCPTQTEANDAKRAGTFADVATAMVIVGGVLAAAGLVLVFVAPSGKSAYVAPTTTGFLVGGTF